MSWWGNKKKDEKKRSPKPGKLLSSSSYDKPPGETGLGETILKGDDHGLHNPLAWENMPSMLQEKFPHLKESSKHQRLSLPAGPGEHPFQFTVSFKQPDDTIPYVVMECDTLNSIALKFDTTPSEIARLNKKPPGLSFSLFPGEVLYVPDADSEPPVTESPKSAPPCMESGSFTESVETIRSSSVSHVSQESKKSQEGEEGRRGEEGRMEEEGRAGQLEGSVEWTTGENEEVTESHLSISAKYISDDQGCVFGSLVINKTSLTFDPNTLDPLVRDRGIEDFKFVIPLEDITYAALTKDCYPPHRKSSVSRIRPIPPPPRVNRATSTTEEDRNDQPQAGPADCHDNGITSDAQETSHPSSGDNVPNRLSPEESKGEENDKIDEGDKLESRTDKVVAELKEAPAIRADDSGVETDDSTKLCSHSDGKLESDDKLDSYIPRTDSNTEQLLFSAPKLEREHSKSNGTEEMLAIMGAVDAEDPSKLRSSTNNSEGTDSDTSQDSLLLDRPNFLHVRVSSKSGHVYTYVPLSQIGGIDIPAGEGRRKRLPSPVQHVKHTFCFAVPERRIEDLVSFISAQHPLTLGGVGSPFESQSWKEGSYEFLGRLDIEALSFQDDHFQDPESSSWEIFSWQDIQKYRTKIDKMEVDEHSLPLPNLQEETDMMEEHHMRKLAFNLPSRAVGHDWYLIYSTFKHGISLRTLYRNMQNYEDTPVLLLVRDQEKKLFGAVMSCPLKISDHFYGTGESFLFSFEGSDMRVFHWTAANSYCVKGNSDSIGFGSGDGHFGLWLDEYFYHGSSYSCSTYNNDCLASQQDFVCSGIEAWGFSDSHYM